MNLNTPLVLVTGAAGWLGSRLVESLVRGLPGNDALKTPAPDLRIRCLLLPGQDAAPLRKLSNRIEIVTGDIRNAADCARLCTDAKGAILFHTAGIIHPRRVAEFYAINLHGTKHLLDDAIKAGVRREAIAAVRDHRAPAGLTEDEALVVAYVVQLLQHHRVDDATFAAMRDRFGVEGVVELTATVGYYGMLACVLNAFDVAPEAGADVLPA